MAPNKLVLIYFDVPGLAEPIRWALAQSGLEWEEKRLSREQFGELKPTFPNGQVPVLEIDGYPLPQSHAITLYVGRIGGLYPTDYLEAAKCDAILCSIGDMWMNIRPVLVEKDEAKKMELQAEFVDNFLPTWFGNVEKKLGQAEGLYFLDKMTVADISMANIMRLFRAGDYVAVPPSVIDAYPKLMALTESIMAEPKIAEYIAKSGTPK
ncbi:unnamed protein product [Ascophyllum nodosum]